MALAILDKYAPDPDFREMLRTHGAAVDPADRPGRRRAADDRLPPGQDAAVVHASRWPWRPCSPPARTARRRSARSKNDGLERVAQLERPHDPVLPVPPAVRRDPPGQRDAPGLRADLRRDDLGAGRRLLRGGRRLEPGGLAARGGRRRRGDPLGGQGRGPPGGASRPGRELAEASGESVGEAIARQETGKGLERAAAEGTSTATERLARWWTVRSAGGIYQVLRRLPEALPRLSLAQITEMAGPLCAKAGLRLTTWRPVRFLKDGAEVVLRIPPERGLKYLTAQMLQAGVGVVGFQKMEEHLASEDRRRFREVRLNAIPIHFSLGTSLRVSSLQALTQGRADQCERPAAQQLQNSEKFFLVC